MTLPTPDTPDTGAPAAAPDPALPDIVRTLREQLDKQPFARPLAVHSTIPGATAAEFGSSSESESLSESFVTVERGMWSSGCESFDRWLPAGGLRRGTLVEFLGQPAGGAGTLAFLLACRRSRQGGSLVVLDPDQTFYPPAAALWGVPAAHLFILRATDPADQLWALIQALRCRGVGAVWAPLERTVFDRLSGRDFRRLQLAVEAGQGVGFFVRSLAARRRPSWADLQFQVQPLALPDESPPWRRRRLQIHVTRSRQGPSSTGLVLDVDEVTGTFQVASENHEPHPLHLATSLAHPAPRGRSTSA